MLKAILSNEQTDRLTRGLAVFGLSPNAWTIISLLPALAGLAALAMHHLATGMVLFALSGAIDMVDGAVARSTGKATAKGAFLDGVVDRYVELLLCLGLLLYLGRFEFFRPSFGGLVRAAHIRIDHDQLRAGVCGPSRRGEGPGRAEADGRPPGAMERLMLLFTGMLLGLFDPQWLMAAIAATAVLANATALQRIAFAFRHGK